MQHIIFLDYMMSTCIKLPDQSYANSTLTTIDYLPLILPVTLPPFTIAPSPINSPFSLSCFSG